jgi:hypothetical protein
MIDYVLSKLEEIDHNHKENYFDDDIDFEIDFFEHTDCNYISLLEINGHLYICSSDDDGYYTKYRWPGTKEEFKMISRYFKRKSECEILPAILIYMLNKVDIRKYNLR